jgi:hypothetical protein
LFVIILGAFVLILFIRLVIFKSIKSFRAK